MTREQADTKLDMEVDHPNTETMAIKREVLVGEHPDTPPQTRVTPTIRSKCSSLERASDFVSRSAGMSSVGQ